MKINVSIPIKCLIPGEDGRVRPAEQGERGVAEQAELDVDGGGRVDHLAPRGRELAAGGRRQEEGPLHPQDHQGQASWPSGNLMKKILETFYKFLFFQGNPVSMFVLQTLVLYECEKHPREEDWEEVGAYLEDLWDRSSKWLCLFGILVKMWILEGLDMVMLGGDSGVGTHKV